MTEVRTCVHPDCSQPLSRYNVLAVCHQHSRSLKVPPILLRQHFPVWTQDAKCAGADVEVFFSEETSDEGMTSQVRDAKAVCRTCPVRRPCLEWAYAIERAILSMHKADERTKEEGELVALREGIFGGATGPERHRFAHRPVEALLRELDRQAEMDERIQSRATVLVKRAKSGKVEVA